MLSKRQGIGIDAMNRSIAEDYVEKIIVDWDEDLVEIHFKGRYLFKEYTR